MALYKGTMILVVLFLSLCLIISSTEFASFTAANWENILAEISAMSPKSPWLATTDPHKCITEVNNLGFNVYHFTHMYLGWTSFSVHSPSFEISLWNSSQCAYGYTILNNRVTFSDLMMILLFTYICHQVLSYGNLRKEYSRWVTSSGGLPLPSSVVTSFLIHPCTDIV